MAKNSKKLQKEVFSAEFHKFCRKNIQAPMRELEKTRHNYIFAICCVIALLTIFAGIILTSAYINESFNSDIIQMLFGIFAVGAFCCTTIAKRYKTNAKEIILPQLLSYIGEFKILDKNNVSKYLTSYLHGLDLISEFNTSSFDDCLHGTYNGVELGISETELTYVTRSGKHRHSRPVFKGLFVCFKSFKKFQYRTIIKRDTAFFLTGREKVSLEDPEFESLYSVISDDQIEARYLITPAFMNRMVELNKKGIGRMMTVSFEEDNVNIAISSSKDWFEIPLFKPATDIVNYRAIILELISIFSIIDTLKLDQNIGA